ncbi:MAG: Putative permease [uncultured Campylobacterales bacterium]|uniref:Permease n=1 Tax=uncultured Campylobacterales bacterium TaxID=352960 RepID=A0A6S6S066_9BACT|nr:MAG: Putative permease [uncultured Campylobacterales bacterium]
MEIFYELAIKICFLYSFIFMGFVMTKVFDLKLHDTSKMLIYLVAPVVVFFGGYNVDINVSVLFAPVLLFFIFTFILYFSFYLLKLLGRGENKRILSYVCASTNAGYLGIPIAIFIFDEASIYILSCVGIMMATSSVGVYLISRGKYSLKQSLINTFSIPLIYMVLLGLVLNYNEVKLPETILMYENYFKYSYSFLGMFIAGIALGQIKKIEFDKFFIFWSLFFSYIIWPVVVFGVIYIDGLFLDLLYPELEKVFILISILPMAAVVIPYASIFNYNVDKIAFTLVINTLFAVLYLPVMIYLLGLS